MAKPRRGGRRSTASMYTNFPGGGSATPPPQTQPNPPVDEDEDEQTIDSSVSGEINQTLDDFRKMSPDQQAQVILDSQKEAPPSFLPDNPSQRFLWYIGGDDKPTILSDAQMDALGGRDIYRQVAGIHDSTLGTNLSSAHIANQLMTGDFTQYAQDWGVGGGGTAWGRAIYFGARYSDTITYYGTSRNIRGQQDSTAIRCQIKKGAKGMSYGQLQSACQREISSGSKLGRALRSIGNSDDRETIYALAKGIDYSHDGSYDYHMIYNRRCLNASSRTKHNPSDSHW